MGVFYPQAIVSLRLRFDDFGDKENPVYKEDYVINTFAKTLRVNINDYTKADTFDMQLDYKQFPFDPRLLRSCAVTIYIEDKKKLFQSGATQDDNRLNEIKPNKDNVVFVGFADKSKIELNENDRIVHLEGRDYTALLIDLPYFGGPINLDLPVDQAIRAILDNHVATKNIVLEKRLSDGEVIPTLAALGGEISSALGNKKNAQKDDSYWEIIQRIINDSGLIAYIEIDKLVITKPRNLYDRKKSKIFAYGRNVKSLEFDRKLGRQKGFNIRAVSVNLLTKTLIEAKVPEEASETWAKEMGIKREAVKIAKPIAFQLNTTTPSTLNQTASTQTSSVTTPNNNQATQDEIAPYFTFKFTNIADKDHLVVIAQKIFEELGRQQLEGTFESHEMVIADNQGEEFNIMQLRIGTPLEILIDGSDLEGIKKIIAQDKGSHTIDSRVIRNKMRQFLIAQGYQESSKLVEVMSLATARIDTPFYTREIEFMVEENSGFTLKVDFVNFINLPQGLAEGHG